MKFLDNLGLEHLVTKLKTIFQPMLISSENIKTINGESILGKGNLSIGSSGDNDEFQTLKAQVQTLNDKLQVLTNFNGLAIPLNIKNGDVTFQELQEELDILTDSRYEVVNNSYSDGMNMSGLQLGSVQIRDRQTDELFRLMISFNS